MRRDCGDDAFFLTAREERITLGVADGVSSWSRYGVNPALFAWELMLQCEKAAHRKLEARVPNYATGRLDVSLK